MDDVMARALEALVPGGVKRGELARGQRALRWVEAGSGGPAVVLDAAGGTPALTWAPVLPALAEHTRVLAYDRAGFGASDPAARLTLEFIRVFALRMALGLADGALRGQAENNARRATGDPHVRELLVEAELACYGRVEHVRAVREEIRVITAAAPAIRRLRAGARVSARFLLS